MLHVLIAVKKIFSILYSCHIPFSCTPDTDIYCNSWKKTRQVTNLIIEDVNLRTFRKKAIYVINIRDIISTIIFLHRCIYVGISLQLLDQLSTYRKISYITHWTTRRTLPPGGRPLNITIQQPFHNNLSTVQYWQRLQRK